MQVGINSVPGDQGPGTRDPSIFLCFNEPRPAQGVSLLYYYPVSLSKLRFLGIIHGYNHYYILYFSRAYRF